MKFSVSDEMEMARDCSNWQQLDLMKRRIAERLSGQGATGKKLEEMTRSERLMWYKFNKHEVEADQERTKYCSNYRQLQLARGRGKMYLEGDSDEMEDIDRVRSRRLQWYRNGGSEVVEAEKDLARLCNNWRQYHLLTRPRRQEADEEEEEREPTRSEKLAWYRRGGVYQVEGTHEVANNSENWIQFKLTMDAEAHARRLTSAVEQKYSEFISKEALSNHMMKLARESRYERDELREYHRTREVRDSVTKEAFSYRLKPYNHLEIEDAMLKTYVSKKKIQEKEETLRQITEDYMMMKSQYAESAHEMALKAMKEEEEAVAASRIKRRTMVVEQNKAVTAAE